MAEYCQNKDYAPKSNSKEYLGKIKSLRRAHNIKLNPTKK